MASHLDTEAGTERFADYEAELKLVQADLAQKLDQIPELSGEPRKAAISAAERAVEEADELLGQLRLEKANIPSPHRAKTNARFRNHESDVDAARRRLRALSDERAALFGARYTDDPAGPGGGPSDRNLAQRQQLLSGSDRLDRSTQRLKNSQALANETEGHWRQHPRRPPPPARDHPAHPRDAAAERGLCRPQCQDVARHGAMATNRVITIAIITILVLLIVAVIFSKFR
ncbi:vesicle transport v-SNARE protein [Verticillium alfalfae VaMs.102]|uniref:Vesicle transport v-SNARE protein n=1 Tax=Verticillium alfalfae (strain VaMs.102 / ATCC MYA-4576 / FGSC 10136) TaxID=526221 RepID=C9SAM0_VERA1|nr:vesicle transport v-SNARE protein [Verticillium alfalfae VaMs.102]EEY15468.1 vesicle transport v-SNARE protein [Verticillium alfalfae VaMs.102]